MVEWNSRHSEILSSFLLQLEKVGVRYVILKNANGLPYDNFSKDVDILIEPGKYNKAEQCLRLVYNENALTHLKIHKFEKLRCWYGADLESRFAIHIDLLEGSNHKGVEILPFELLYQESYINDNAIRVLSPVMEACVLLIHSSVCYRKIKLKYREIISKVFTEQREDFTRIIRGLIGTRIGSRVLQLIHDDDYDCVEGMGLAIGTSIKMKSFFKNPFGSIFSMIKFYKEKIDRLVICRDRYKMFFSVHAPDGTGKTTFIEALEKEIAFYFCCEPQTITEVNHFRPCVLPNIGAVAEKVHVAKQDRNFTDPHRAKPSGFFASIIRMAYYCADYIIGMPILLRRMAQFDKVLIFDRYVYDFLIDPLRSRIKLPYWVRSCFAKMVCQPQLVFALTASPVTVYSRKQELSIEEIDRQMKALLILKELGSHVHFLNAEAAPTDLARNAAKIFFDAFAERL